MRSPTSSPENKRVGPIRSLSKSLGNIRTKFSGKPKPEFTVISASRNICGDEQESIDESAQQPGEDDDNGMQLSELGPAFNETARYAQSTHVRTNSIDYNYESYKTSEFHLDNDEFAELIDEANQLPEDESVRREDLELVKKEGSMHRQISQLSRDDSFITFLKKQCRKSQNPRDMACAQSKSRGKHIKMIRCNF